MVPQNIPDAACMEERERMERAVYSRAIEGLQGLRDERICRACPKWTRYEYVHIQEDFAAAG